MSDEPMNPELQKILDGKKCVDRPNRGKVHVIINGKCSCPSDGYPKTKKENQ